MFHTSIRTPGSSLDLMVNNARRFELCLGRLGMKSRHSLLRFSYPYPYTSKRLTLRALLTAVP